MSKDLEKRVLVLELDNASKRFFWNVALVLFCTVIGLFDLVAGAIVPAIILLALGGLNVVSLPKNWNELKRLRTVYRETVPDSETE